MTKTPQELEDEKAFHNFLSNLIIDKLSAKAGYDFGLELGRSESDARIKQLEDQLLEGDTRTILSWIERKQFFGHSPISIMQIIEDILNASFNSTKFTIEIKQKGDNL